MWDDPKALNTLALVLVACALGAFVATAILWAARQPAFAIRHVVVRGDLKEVNRAHLEAVARESLYGTFFTLNLDHARAAFARVPWVRSATVRRSWPDRLEVTLTEHEPLARWLPPAGEAALVNTEGEVFRADYAEELPLFSGPEGSSQEVSRRYQQSTQALAAIGRSPTAIRLSAQRGWELQLDNELALELGREQVMERLARFVSLYPATVARVKSSVGYVDMRYPNGFAARVAGFVERGGEKKPRTKGKIAKRG
jgi:cell division protein FtsQ